jgi:pimeloyl-ACP methyl ester carboxylesterase
MTGLASPPAVTPCVGATAACMEPLALPGSAKWIGIYRTYSLNERNASVTRAFILVHGMLRDADSHFRTAVAGGFLASRLGDTVIIAPRFASSSAAQRHQASGCRDSMGAGEANWKCEAPRTDTWRSGGPETDTPSLSSFDVVDALIAKLSDRNVFPNLSKIVVAGHSAGGQFVVRYAMTSTLMPRAGVTVSYIVANPSSYAYLDGWRPKAGASLTPGRASTEFAPFEGAAKCPTYNNWPYGLDRRRGYAGRLKTDDLIRQFVSRPVTYLLGDADVLTTGVFDSSCPAGAQGASRLARGLAFADYMRERFNARHEVVTVPSCGHNARCMFTADVSLSIMFPN